MNNQNSDGNASNPERFATEEKEARKLFDRYRSKDPFPKIYPALLNSSDISDYVEVTGMIVPFYIESLKSASYEVNLLGEIIYWDETGKKVTKFITHDMEFKLRKHSIAYVTSEPTFLLPDYMALRFNLKITHVHRGILLGTGPLVDPGFEGKLLIPLHNLTNNDYILRGGEGLIWVEFTKISDNERWKTEQTNLAPQGEYVPFPEDKKNKSPEYYFGKAMKGQESSFIQSSIPLAVAKAEKSAQDVADIKKWAKRVSIGGSILGALGILVAVITLFQPTLSLVKETTSYISDTKERILDRSFSQETTIKAQEQEIKNIKTDIKILEEKFEKLDKALTNP